MDRTVSNLILQLLKAQTIPQSFQPAKQVSTPEGGSKSCRMSRQGCPKKDFPRNCPFVVRWIQKDFSDMRQIFIANAILQSRKYLRRSDLILALLHSKDGTLSSEAFGFG
eukprot:TRINITY_DN474_c0_g1_i12.p3 TRINITY_DN474_c0_g1~~TRINITY_DN474_c0_g1_i12.p3  ORF type:complete len:110 (-),score=4.71 TRINITY_DN474_c0_g1_i12:823-1152(-)